MGKRGPKPEPTVLKIAKGNPGKRPLNKREPLPPVSRVVPPDWLSGVALEKWQEVVPLLLDMGVMTDADIGAVARYCTMFEQYLSFLKVVRETQDSKASSMLMKLAASLLRIEQEFGMTASARSGIVSTKDTAPKDDLEAFFSKHG